MSSTSEAEGLILSEEGDTQCKMSRGEGQKQVHRFPSAQGLGGLLCASKAWTKGHWEQKVCFQCQLPNHLGLSMSGSHTAGPPQPTDSEWTSWCGSSEEVNTTPIILLLLSPTCIKAPLQNSHNRDGVLWVMARDILAGNCEDEMRVSVARQTPSLDCVLLGRLFLRDLYIHTPKESEF